MARSFSEGTDYSYCTYWDKAREETRTLFHELEAFVESIGSIWTDVRKSQFSFKCLGTSSSRKPVVAHVQLRTKSVGLLVHVLERHVSGIPLENGFTHLVDKDQYRAFTILDPEHIRKAKPLLRTAYESIRTSAPGR